MTAALGRFGVWRRHPELSPELAAELERLGYGTLWIGGSAPPDLALAEQLLAATQRLTVATGIVNIWTADADAVAVAAAYHRVAAKFHGRFLLGIGVGHPESTGARYQRPYQALVSYLDVLDAEGVPAEHRVLAALGPKLVRLAGARTAGAHPYLTTPEHTRQARELLGPGALLAPEHKVVLDTDPECAREIGRPRVHKPYLGLSNYLTNLRRLGFTDLDLAGGGSDRLIDALVAHGEATAVAARLREHLDAGADHVAVQLLTDPGADPLPGFGELAAALRIG